MPSSVVLALVAANTACAPQAALPPERPEVRSPSAALRDERLSPVERARAIVAALSLPEKVAQLMHEAPAIERLGIPAYNWCSEALHGVARAGLATVFPQAIGLAATWDEALVHDVASAAAAEARAKHHAALPRGDGQVYRGLTLWSPNINLFRDPRWGRGQETYGEDPFLTGRLGVQFVRGLQGDDPRYLKTAATLKHLAVHSGPEPLRHEFDAQVDARELNESYLPQFEMGVREANPASVMCAYNRVNGQAACAHDGLLGETLRGKWKFEGLVVSDCRAIEDLHAHHHLTGTPAESAALALRRGTDLECGRTYANLEQAVQQQLISEAEIDRSLQRLFEVRVRLGMFDDPAHVPFAGLPASVVDSAEHRRLALRAAEESIVLLKNAGGTLPLKRDLRTLAIIGPNADQWITQLGNYNGVPADAVTPLEGIRQAVSPKTHVVYAQGSEFADGMPAFVPVPAQVLVAPTGEPGLELSVFAGNSLEGAPVVRHIVSAAEVDYGDAAPQPELNGDDFGLRWVGRLVPQVSGPHWLGVHSTMNTVVRLDGKTVVETRYRLNNELADPRLRRSAALELKAGQSYDIEVVGRETYGDARLGLVWAPPRPNLKSEALAAAKSADAVVLVMGLSANLEGEQLDLNLDGFSGGDRTRLELPAPQRALVRDIVHLGKPVVLVNMSGSALALPWEQQHVPAIVQAWYPGQAAGDALARVIFGEVSPAARLPVTFYRSESDLPAFSDYHLTTQTYRFFRGKPVYPFGYGLSYTRFHYDELELPQRAEAGAPLTVAARVTNVGERASDEVVQAYVSTPPGDARAPVRSLVAFKRLHLTPGESMRVEFQLPPERLASTTDAGVRVHRPGRYTVSLGGGQPLLDTAATSDFVQGQVELLVGGTAP